MAKKGLLDRLQQKDANIERAAANKEQQNRFNEVQSSLRQQVVEIVKARNVNIASEKAKEQIRDIALQVMENIETRLSKSQKSSIIDGVIHDMLGFGPLEPLLQQSDITEIMVNGPKQVYIERNGNLEESDITFKDNEHVKHVIERIVAPLGRRIDESSPMVDARLPDGSRVNAIIPPIALDGPSITIRKFSEDKLTYKDLIGFGSITQEMVAFLEACVLVRKNIVVSGGTGSGKTTFLNIMSNFIPKGERIVTIEDSAELQLAHRYGGNLVRLESKPANIEGKGEITIHDLVKNSLRMRPDRVIIGEIRGEEAIEMLQAMNTGHDGSLSTVHANSPKDALSRLETMTMMAGLDLPSQVVRDNIGSAIHLICQLSRLSDGSRRATAIEEIVGYDKDNDKFETIPLFRFKQTGKNSDGKVLGYFTATGRKPSFLEQINAQGIDLSMEIFKAKKA
ncbi:MAG: CpaF family protein [bacterium]